MGHQWEDYTAPAVRAAGLETAGKLQTATIARSLGGNLVATAGSTGAGRTHNRPDSEQLGTACQDNRDAPGRGEVRGGGRRGGEGGEGQRAILYSYNLTITNIFVDRRVGCPQLCLLLK